MEIAGTLRNSFRASVENHVSEVEHWIGAGPSPGTNLNQTPNADTVASAVRLSLIRAMAKRERAQTAG